MPDGTTLKDACGIDVPLVENAMDNSDALREYQASRREHSKHCPAHAGGTHIPELCDDTEAEMTEPVDANGIWQKHTMLREAAIARARATYQRSIADAEDEFATGLAKEAVNAIMVNAGRGGEVLP